MKKLIEKVEKAIADHFNEDIVRAYVKINCQPESDPIIQERENFYGYIKSVGFYNSATDESYWGGMYAIFEYQNQTTRWQVPDIELFDLLVNDLRHEALQLSQSDNFHTKLWIGKKDGKWWTDLP